MEQETIRFEQRDNDVFVYGYPELKDRKGILAGDKMALFFGEGWRNYELYIANTITGKIRKLSTTRGELLVDDNDMPMDARAFAAKLRKYLRREPFMLQSKIVTRGLGEAILIVGEK